MAINKYYPVNLEIQFYKIYKNCFYKIIDSLPKIYFKDSTISTQNEIETEIEKQFNAMTPLIASWSNDLVKFANKSFKQKISATLKLKTGKKYTIEALQLALKQPQLETVLRDYYYSLNIYKDSVKAELLQKTLPVTVQAVERGASMKTVKKELMDLYSWSDKKASLHASTSVANILSAVDREHYTQNGLEYYIWSTSNDQRVRPTHRALNGMKRKLGEGIEPGQEFRCRCTKLPDPNEIERKLFG